MAKLLEFLLPWGPVIFGVSLLAPKAAAVMNEMDFEATAGSPSLYLALYWLPHHPMKEMGRYRDTRGWKSSVGTILTVGMEYHLVHHLFPSIPLNRTPAAYRKLKPLLEAEGVSLNGL